MTMHHHVIWIRNGEVRIRSSEVDFSPVLDEYAHKIDGVDDLRNVYKEGDLVRIHNHLTPGKQIKSFHDKTTAVGKVWALLETNKPPAEAEAPGPAGETEQPAPPSGTPATYPAADVAAMAASAAEPATPTAAAVHEESDEDMAKALKQTRTEKKAKKAKAERGPGVISTLIELLKKAGELQTKGKTVDELTEALAKRFPERKADAMKSTVKIQLSRLPAEGKLKVKSEKEEGKPTRYWA